VQLACGNQSAALTGAASKASHIQKHSDAVRVSWILRLGISSLALRDDHSLVKPCSSTTAARIWRECQENFFVGSNSFASNCLPINSTFMGGRCGFRVAWVSHGRKVRVAWGLS
jgi:hypothetical protein